MTTNPFWREILVLTAGAALAMAQNTPPSRSLSLDYGEKVSSIVASPDSRFVAISEENKVVIFEIATGTRRLEIDLPNALSNSSGRKLTLGQQNLVLVCDETTRRVDVWSLERKQRIREFPTGECGANAISPDGKFIAFGDRDQIFTADVGSGALRPLGNAADDLLALEFSGDSRDLFSTDLRGLVLTWNVEQQRRISRMDGLPFANSAKMVAGGTRILFSKSDHSELWDLPSESLIWQGDAVVSVILHSDAGDRLAVLEKEAKRVTIYDATGDLKEPMRVVTLQGGLRTRYSDIAGGGNYVAASGRPTVVFPLVDGHNRLTLDRAFVLQLVTEDGRWFLANDDSAKGDVVRIWKIDDRPSRPPVAATTRAAPPGKVSYPFPIHQAAPISAESLDFSPDGRLVILNGDHQNGNALTVWNAATGHLLKRESAGKYFVRILASRGKLITLSAARDNRRLEVADSISGKVLTAVDLGERWRDSFPDVPLVAVSPDGRRLAVAFRSEPVRLVDLSNGTVRRLQPPKDAPFVDTLVFLANGAVLSVRRADAEEQWDPVTARLLRQNSVKGGTDQDYADRVSSAQFRLRYAAEDDSKLIIMRASDGQTAIVKTPEKLDGSFTPVVAAAISADGKSARALFEKGWYFEWVLPSGRLNKQIKLAIDNRGFLQAAAFSPDGERFAYAWFGDAKHYQVRSARTLDRFVELGTDAAKGASVSFVGGTHDLVTISSGTTAVVSKWDAVSGSVTFQSIPDVGEGVQSWQLSGDGKTAFRLLRRFDQDNKETDSVAAWSAETQKPLWSSDLAELCHPDDCLSVNYAGDRVATRTKSQLAVWGLDAQQPRQTWARPTEFGKPFLSADGRWLADSFLDATLFEPNGSGSTVKIKDKIVGFSPNGRYGISTSSNEIKQQEIPSGKTLWEMTDINAPTHVLYSRSGDFIALGDSEEIVLRSTATGRRLQVLTGHDSALVNLTISVDGRFLAAMCADSSVRLWDIASGQLRATLSAGSRGQWLVVTPDGLFDGSPDGWRAVRWRLSEQTMDTAPIEIFFNEFFHPGLLAEILGGGNPRATRKIAGIDRRQPSVEVALAGPLGAGQRTVPVKITIRVAFSAGPPPTSSGARDLRLFYNGVLIQAWRGDLKLNERGEAVVNSTAPVIAGWNTLTAYAFNRDNIKSEDAKVSFEGPETLKRQGIAYVITVGVDSYANADFNLRYAGADADALELEWEKNQTALRRFGQVQRITLRNGGATKQALLNALAELQKKAQPEDAVILYFAGHGFAYHDRFYLIPYDLGFTGARTSIVPGSPGFEDIRVHSVSDEEIQAAIEKMRAGTIALIIDACQSGQALEAEESRRGPMNSRGLAQLAYEKGMYILAASQSDQSAMESSSLGHGLLTYVLVEEGLKTSAADESPMDGNIDVREWFDFAVRRVPELDEEITRTRGLLHRDHDSASGQRPRVFYRREVEKQRLVVASPKAN